MIEPGGFTAELPPQGDLGVGQERIVVRFGDGRCEEMRLHEYERVFATPGLYEEVVQRRLECRSPDQVAAMLAGAVASLGWEPAATRVLDVGAGNGVSGAALAARGLRPVAAVDILPAARDAALRDRPGLYERYLAADLLALPDDEADAIRALAPNALSCVGAVGQGHLPPAALAAAAALLAPDALVAYTRALSEDEATWDRPLAALGAVEELDRRRYRHRLTANRRPIEWEAVVLRLRRG